MKRAAVSALFASILAVASPAWSLEEHPSLRVSEFMDVHDFIRLCGADDELTGDCARALNDSVAEAWVECDDVNEDPQQVYAWIVAHPVAEDVREPIRDRVVYAFDELYGCGGD